MRTGIIAPVLAAILGSSAAAQCDRWRLVWSDEFSGTSLNAANWTAADHAEHHNNERQYYTPTAVSVADGVMTIHTSNHPLNGWPYRSALIDTRGKRVQTFGRIEVRAKLPGTQGIWPAIWVLPQSGAWPPEIDIMELLGHDPDRVYHSNHWGQWPNVITKTTPVDGPDYTQTWNTFAVDWLPGRLDFSVNGRLTAQHPDGVPAVPSFIIINTAVGGNWPGYPDGTTVFPQRFDVDYVRVYERAEPSQVLSNPGFESGTSGWVTWGNVFSVTYRARTGARSGKLYGGFTGSYNNSGFVQDRSASAGQSFAGQAWWRNESTDAMQGANTADMRIEFFNAANQMIAQTVQPALSASTPVNLWRWHEVEATAPAGTTRVRFAIVFNQPGMAAGAAFVDDAVFGLVDCERKPGLKSLTTP